MSETVGEIVAAHRSGKVRPEETLAACLARIAAHDDPAVFTAIAEPAMIAAQLRALEGQETAKLPLFGVPVAVKDNIDVAGLATTCACPDYTSSPTRDATAVARLRRAGAIIVGKTNLDQFATGLNGTRSPYGTPRNPIRADLVPGGSSSGSGVAVSAGLVPLALGTDTAGSGRVPAGLTNIVGLKPSLGLVSTTGVVPACRSLDCVSVFALTVADAFAALKVMAGHDPSDPFSRAEPPGLPGAMPPHPRIGVPRAIDRATFGDRESEAAFLRALARLEALGAELVEIEMEPFFETARLLYDGPWVAERYAAVGGFLEMRPDPFNPVVRSIIGQGRNFSAVDAFRGLYRLAELKAGARAAMAGLDAMVVPTMPALATLAQIEAEPIKVNSRLGTYTNFVNLLDMCGLAVPSEIRPDGGPFGVTLLAPAGRDAHLASIGAAFHGASGLTMGATGRALSTSAPSRPQAAAGRIEVAVFGAHLSGLPLNGELLDAGGSFVRKARTSADYRLFLLPEGRVKRPGLLRGRPGSGAPVECEVWSLPAAGFGPFVARIPGPLGIGTVTLDDGSEVKGFLAEANAVAAARDITGYGGWRGFVAAESEPASVAG